jgi:hypothetical protein
MTELDSRFVLRACLRRWYIALPLLAVAAWYAFSYYASVRPVYYANVAVGARGSNEPWTSVDGRPASRNGLLDIGGADLVMNLVVLGFDDPAVRANVVAAGGKGNFTVRMFPPAPAAATAPPLPIVMIEATEPDPDSAERTVQLAAAQIDPMLVKIQRQAGVSEGQMVRPLNASSPKAVGGTPSRNKKTALLLVGGVALAIFAALSVDGLMNRLLKPKSTRVSIKATDSNGEGEADAQNARRVDA